MSISWAKVVAGLASLIKSILAFLVFLAGRKYERAQHDAEQAAKDLELAKDYLDNRDGRTPSDTLGRMQKGDF